MKGGTWGTVKIRDAWAGIGAHSSDSSASFTTRCGSPWNFTNVADGFPFQSGGLLVMRGSPVAQPNRPTQINETSAVYCLGFIQFVWLRVLSLSR